MINQVKLRSRILFLFLLRRVYIRLIKSRCYVIQNCFILQNLSILPWQFDWFLDWRMVYWLSSNLAAFYHLLYFHQNYSPTSQLTHTKAEKQLSDICSFFPRIEMTFSFDNQVNLSATVLWKQHSTKINQTWRLDRNISHRASDFHLVK